MIAVITEVGAKRVFAAAADWPGWCRSGKDDVQALAALEVVAPRYASALAGTGLTPPAAVLVAFEVVEALPGSATTDFGAPGAVAAVDAQPLDSASAQRLVVIVAAAWATLDRVVAAAPPELRKGPRGGGRERDAVAAHVDAADHEYAKKLGVRMKDAPAGERRAAVLDVLGRPNDGQPLVPRGWPSRYAARRIAWHALDHAWEIEDRSES